MTCCLILFTNPSYKKDFYKKNITGKVKIDRIANIFGRSSPKPPIINSDSVLKLLKPFATPYPKEVERFAFLNSSALIRFVIFSVFL